MRKPPIDLSGAESLAINALVFLSQDDNRFQRYVTITGLDSGTIREAAKDAGFLVSVLEYVMQDESLLLQFCEIGGHDPAIISSGHAVLSGTADNSKT